MGQVPQNKSNALLIQAIGLDHVSQVMGYHPVYLEHFLKTQNFIMRADGPLPFNYRHYIAIMASGRHKCSYLISLQKQEFIMCGGDQKWLKGLEHVPKKLQNLYDINKVLAHRPWLLSVSHIEQLTKATKDNWSLAEVVHAIVILAHFHSLCSFVFSCGLNQEIMELAAAASSQSSSSSSAYSKLLLMASAATSPKHLPQYYQQQSNGSNGDQLMFDPELHYSNNNNNDSSVRDSNTVAMVTDQMDEKKIIDKSIMINAKDATVAATAHGGQVQVYIGDEDHCNAAFETAHLSELPTRSSIRRESGCDSVSFASVVPVLVESEDIAGGNAPVVRKVGGAAGPGVPGGLKSIQILEVSSSDAPPSPMEPEVGIVTLMQRMKTLEELSEECTPVELAKRFENVESQSAELAVIGGDRRIETPADISCFIQDAAFAYQDFAKREMQSSYPTFRVQDYSWDTHGYSLVNRLYNDVGKLLDDKFRTTYNMTYYTMGGRKDVDTSKFRRAIWNYIQCLQGIRHDDYDYGEINHLLERHLKTFIKTACCYPERVTKKDYDRVLREFLHSEKVHVNLMVLEAKMQAELLYALRTVNRYSLTVSY